MILKVSRLFFFFWLSVALLLIGAGLSSLLSFLVYCFLYFLFFSFRALLNMTFLSLFSTWLDLLWLYEAWLLFYAFLSYFLWFFFRNFSDHLLQGHQILRSWSFKILALNSAFIAFLTSFFQASSSQPSLLSYNLIDALKLL